ncbi:unnamed protein product, partial [Polarella glacialis]
RIKFEEQQHTLWKRRWAERLKTLSKQGQDLRRQKVQQDKLLEKKTREADRSARRIEELQREQHGHLQASRLKMQLDRQTARAAKVRVANDQLTRALAEREQKIQQLEDMLLERERLQKLGDEGADGLQEVEDCIQSLDAQLEYESESLIESQTDILRLTSIDRELGLGTTTEMPGPTAAPDLQQ